MACNILSTGRAYSALLLPLMGAGEEAGEEAAGAVGVIVFTVELTTGVVALLTLTIGVWVVVTLKTGALLVVALKMGALLVVVLKMGALVVVVLKMGGLVELVPGAIGVMVVPEFL